VECMREGEGAWLNRLIAVTTVHSVQSRLRQAAEGGRGATLRNTGITVIPVQYSQSWGDGHFHSLHPSRHIILLPWLLLLLLS
jgi:hypothetical protein